MPLTVIIAMQPSLWLNLGMLAFLFVCVMLVMAVMIQKPQGGGLSGAFGASSGSGQTAFGTKTGDALTVLTIGLFVVWLLVAMILNWVTAPGKAATVAPAAPSPAPAPAVAPAQAPTDATGKSPVQETPKDAQPAPATPPLEPPEQPAPQTPPQEPQQAPQSPPAEPPATPPGF